VALAAVVLATLVRRFVDPDVAGTALFFPAVGLANWLGGLGPGLLAVVLGTAASALGGDPPVLPGHPDFLGESLRLAVFVFVSLLFTLLVELIRRQGEREQATAREAIEAERKWRSLVENTTDLIAIADREGDVLFANRNAEGPVIGPVAGRTFFDGVPPEHHALIRRELARVVDEEEAGLFEVEAVRADGARGWFESRLVPLAREGGAARVLAISRDITERQREQRILQESAARFRALFDSTLDAMVVADDEGRIVEANGAAAELFAVPAGRLVGTGIWEWSGNRSAFDAAWARFLAEGQMRGDWELRAADGSTRHVEFSATARFLAHRHLSLLRDVTERRRGERATEFLARATRLLASSLEERETAGALARLAVPEVADWCGVDLLGEDGHLSRVALAVGDPRQEEAAWDLVRRAPPDGVDGATLEEALRTGEPAVHGEGTVAALAARTRDADHLRLLKAAGWRSVTVMPLVSGGRTLGVLWFAGTRRALGPGELSLARELADRAGVALENARLYREAQEANRVKDEFLATLSHELRTPLNAIVGWTHLLRTGGLDAPTSQRALETIERNARLQSQLIADILDVSRIVSGKLRVETAPLELGHLMAAAVDAMGPAAAAKGVTLRVDSVEGGARVVGDAGRLQQVAQNLLSNAVKFTNTGGEVRVGLRRTATQAELVVEDTGVGIAEDFLPHVFERFRQGDSSTTRPHGGLGLGLAITRHLVEAHGGSVEAASAGIGRGARFTVRLPLAAPARAPEAVVSVGHPALLELSGVRVLVVDDHPEGINALGAILERAGAAVARAGSSQEAVAVLQMFRPHVVVSDLALPGEDGYALLGRMRALPAERGGNIPALAVTGHGREAESARAMSVGFQQHLSKPVDPGEFALAVAQLAQMAPPRGD
jgi:PAS domain S-box-containing protein